MGGAVGFNRNRPDIIFIMTDQQKASATGCYGNPYVRTPTWNRLAGEGVLFEHAYAPSTICTPCRTSIMTGTSPLVHRVLCHQNHAPVNLRQLPELLSGAGYRCVAAGHYESARSLTRGWDEQIDTHGTPALEKAQLARYRKASREVGWSAGELDLPPERAHAACLNDEIFRLLEGVRTEETPLFLHVSYIEPHPPYFAPGGYLCPGRERFPMPRRGRPDSTPGWQKKARGQYGTAGAGEKDIQLVLAAYYGLISYADFQIDRLLGWLAEHGRLENSWIILCSDHGDYAGEKGMFTKTETPYECLQHVPLIIRGPGGGWHSGERTDELIDLTDLFPTILAMAGCDVPCYAQGYDLKGWIEGGCKEHLRDAVFSGIGEYHGPLKTTMPWGLPHAGRHPGLVRGARNRSFSYIRDPDYGDEAYELNSDPLELCNLLQAAGGVLPSGISKLKELIDDRDKECRELYTKLGVIPGARNFQDTPDRRITGG